MLLWMAGDPTEKETEAISQIWQTDLFNANYEIQRFAATFLHIETNRDRVLYCDSNHDNRHHFINNLKI